MLVKKYAFAYFAPKTGHDRFTVQTVQGNALTGKPTEVTLHVDVEIVDKPF